MRIAVVSDTHRNNTYINKAKEYIKECDVLIHLGDNIDDVKELSRDFKGEVYAVKGNCDFTNDYPNEQIIRVEGVTILFTHGHMYNVKRSMDNIYYKAKEVNADIVLFGHTHENLIIKEDGIIFMNPGSVSLPRLKGRYVGFIDIEQGKQPDVYLKELN